MPISDILDYGVVFRRLDNVHTIIDYGHIISCLDKPTVEFQIKNVVGDVYIVHCTDVRFITANDYVLQLDEDIKELSRKFHSIELAEQPQVRLHKALNKFPHPQNIEIANLYMLAIKNEPIPEVRFREPNWKWHVNAIKDMFDGVL